MWLCAGVGTGKTIYLKAEKKEHSWGARNQLCLLTAVYDSLKCKGGHVWCSRQVPVIGVPKAGDKEWKNSFNTNQYWVFNRGKWGQLSEIALMDSSSIKQYWLSEDTESHIRKWQKFCRVREGIGAHRGILFQVPYRELRWGGRLGWTKIVRHLAAVFWLTVVRKLTTNQTIIVAAAYWYFAKGKAPYSVRNSLHT